MKRIASGCGILAALALVVMLGWPQLQQVVAQAVNSLAITISATTVAPILSATGTDTNIAIQIQPKGASPVQLTQGSNAAVGIHLEAHQVSPPTIVAGTCAGGSVTSGSTDIAGEIAANSNLCMFTFATPWTNAPFCTATVENAVTGPNVSASQLAATITFGASNSSNKAMYVCMGRF